MSQIFVSLAPIRICDLGGWSDTWFAKHGTVLNIAVSPYVECRMEVAEVPRWRERFYFTVDDYGDRYRIDPKNVIFDRHPLLEACVKAMPIPEGLDVEISLHSSIPGGSSTGTSAAVTVALLRALDCLTPGRLAPDELARKAHEVETVHLGQQSGIQDQLCSAYGGICFIEMDAYPHAKVTQLKIADKVRDELESRLSVIFLGRGHQSSSVHEEVIRGLVNGTSGDKLEPLRREAVTGRDALLAGDLTAFGEAMIRNTEAQANLHASLVSETARTIFDIAKQYGAIGWKVNGAGGDGGSVTILSGSNHFAQKAMLEEIKSLGNGIREIGIRLNADGVTVISG
ncbi:MAG: GHMP kinase [Kiritimatiellae bacterium]|nr:GHMP kinase [Kiritimatiellia bacterium]MBP5227331.1 GHMP kinase [Kiritimatiellia bacterium]